MDSRHVLAALAALAFCGAASAQNLKPGLWEVTSDMKGGGGDMGAAMAQMQKEMAGMSPEQRKMMQDMMAKQGVQMGAGGAMSVKMCLTREQVERNEIPVQQGDCKTTRQQRSGNTTTMAFACANPPSTGEGTYTIQSPEAYTMKMVVKTSVQGKPQTMNMDASGKWLGANCGDIKPMQPPPAGKK